MDSFKQLIDHPQRILDVKPVSIQPSTRVSTTKPKNPGKRKRVDYTKEELEFQSARSKLKREGNQKGVPMKYLLSYHQKNQKDRLTEEMEAFLEFSCGTQASQDIQAMDIEEETEVVQYIQAQMSVESLEIPIANDLDQSEQQIQPVQIQCSQSYEMSTQPSDPEMVNDVKMTPEMNQIDYVHQLSTIRTYNTQVNLSSAIGVSFVNNLPCTNYPKPKCAPAKKKSCARALNFISPKPAAEVNHTSDESLQTDANESLLQFSFSLECLPNLRSQTTEPLHSYIEAVNVDSAGSLMDQN